MSDEFVLVPREKLVEWWRSLPPTSMAAMEMVEVWRAAPPAALDVETKMFLIDDIVPQRVIVEVWHNNEIIAGDSLELAAAQPSKELASNIRELAKRFSEGWHEGIEIDATDIMNLSLAADALESLK